MTSIQTKFSNANIPIIRASDINNPKSDFRVPSIVMVFWEACGYCHTASGEFVALKEMLDVINVERKRRNLPAIKIFGMDFELSENVNFVYKELEQKTVPQFIIYSSTGERKSYFGTRTAEAFYSAIVDFEQEIMKELGLKYSITTLDARKNMEN